MKAVLLYNTIVFIADLVFLLVVARKRKSWEVISVMTACMLTAAVSGVLVGTTMFDALALYSYAVFLHGLICFIGLSAISWRSSRRTGTMFLMLAILLPVVALDSFFVEPQWLEVSRVEIHSDKIERPIKIVVIADLQTDEIGAYEERVFERTMAEKPDLILLAGDYFQAYPETRRKLAAKVRSFLHQIHFSAPLGIYAVPGNIDRGEWPDAFRDLPVTTILKTRTIATRYLDLTALIDRDSWNTELKVQGTKRFHITMGHRPDFALGEIDSDLLIAGHTHGGQVQIPFWGPVMILSRVPRSWASGVTKLDRNRTLVVSRGVGMERGGAPEVRFLCRPELVVLTIVPTGKQTDGLNVLNVP